MKYKNIEKNFDKLLKQQREEYSRPAPYLKDVEAVWVAVSDRADSYEVNEEWIGVKRDGTLVWAYASGCSCWDGDYEFKDLKQKTMKAVELVHEREPKEWTDAIKKFDADLEIVYL